MRRGVGIQGIQKQKIALEQYKEKGGDIQNLQIAQLNERLQFFKENLEEFARKHKKEINKDPEFRHQFQVMCNKIGVDPLASKKGFWAELLGVGDFYYELSVQIVEVCLSTKAQNGGIIEVSELLHRLQKKRGKSAQAISEDDVKQAISKLKILGNGFDLVAMGDKKLVKSVPSELTGDHTAILGIAQTSGYVTEDEVVSKLNWSRDRVVDALDTLLREGFAWVDDQMMNKRAYWFPGLIDQDKMEETDASSSSSSSSVDR